MTSLEIKINNRYKENVFINNPLPYDETSKIEVVVNKDYNDNFPLFSIVVPIHNQERIIERNLQSIIDNMTEENFELILIIDACSDNTKSVIFDSVEKLSNLLLTKLIILESFIPLFETSADNLGFYCSRGDYILEIQADMQILEYGFNMKLLKPFKKLDNIIAISGRCCCDLTIVQNRGGNIIDKLCFPEAYQKIDKEAFYIGETCNRGPLILDRKKLVELQYLDEKNYFLDNSDHDLFVRAYIQKGYICGHISVDFYAPFEDGSTRKPRNELNQKVYNYKKSTCERNGFLEYFFKDIYPLSKRREIYKIEV